MPDTVPFITPLDPIPSRVTPQERNDTQMKAWFDQFSAFTDEMNTETIPPLNAIAEDVSQVVANLPAVQGAAQAAEDAATSALEAAESAHEASVSAASADASAIAAAESAAEAADIVGIEVSEDAGPGKTPKATALGVLKDEWLDGGLFKPGMLVASQAPLSAPDWLETGREYLNTAYPALRSALGTRINESPINLNAPLNTASAQTRSYKFSPDGNYLLAARYGSNSTLRRVTVWKREGLTLTALPSPVSPDLTTSAAVAWCHDNVHFVVAGFGFLCIGKVESDVVTIIKTITDSTISVNAVAVSPDGVHIAVSLNGSGYIRVYTHDADWNLTVGTIPSSTSLIMDLSFSLDGAHLLVRMGSSAPITVFLATSPGVFAQLTTLATNWTSQAQSLAWHPSGDFVAIPDATTTTAGFKIYRRAGNVYTQFASFSETVSSAFVAGCSFTSDGRHLVLSGKTLTVHRFLPKRTTDAEKVPQVASIAHTLLMYAPPTITPDSQLCVTGGTINLLGYDAGTSFHVPAAKADFAQTIYVKS